MASASTSKEYQLAIKIAGQVSSSFNSAMGDAGQQITNLGSIAQKAAAVAAAAWGALQLGSFISDAVDTYQGFEQAMANTSAIAGATGEEYDALRQAALDMGKATSKTAEECADALGYMALAGWDVNTSIASLEPVLRLSEATGMDLAQCSDLVTDSMSALGLTTEELSGYLDLCAQTNNKANTTAEALMEAFIACGGAAKTAGVDMSDLSTALGILANNGTKGSEAGTALNSMLSRMTTNSAALTAFEELGVAVFDDAGNFRGLETVLGDTSAALSNLSDSERLAYMKSIAGTNYFTEMSYLLDAVAEGADGTASAWADLEGQLSDSDGALMEMAEAVTNTWEGATARLDSAVDDLKINLVSTFAPYATSAINSVAAAIPNITDAIIPAIQSFVDYAIPKIQAFKDRAVELFGMASEGISQVLDAHSGTFDKLGELGSRLGDVFAGIQTQAQPILDYIFGTGIPNVVDGLLTIVDRLADLGLYLTEHKELVIAAIAAYAGFKTITAISSLGNKIAAASKTLEAFQQVTRGTSLVTSALNGKLPAASTAFGVLTGKIKLTELATEAAKTKLSTFTGGFKTIGTVAKNAFTGLKSGITSIGTTLAGVGGKITAFIAANPAVLIIAAIAAVIAIVVVLYNKCEWFRNKVNAIIEVVKGYLSEFWEKAKEVFQQIWDVIQDVWSQIQPYLEAAWQAIISAVSAVVDFFQTNVLPSLKAVWNSIVGAFTAAWNAIKTVWEIVKPFFLAIWEGIKGIFAVVGPILGGFFQSAWAIIKAVWDVAVQFFSLVWEGIKAVFSVVGPALSGFFSTAWELIKAVWNNVAAFFQAVFDTIAGIFSVVQAVLSGDFSAAWEAIKSVVSSWGAFFGTVWEGIKAIFGSVVSWFSGVFSAAWEAIKAVFAGVGEFFQGVWDTIVSLFGTIGTAVGDAISGAVKGAINAVLRGAVNIINGFISAINVAIGIINAIPGVSINKVTPLQVPQLAEGGVVTEPTLLEAGEAGNEAIIPLGELWSNMQSLITDAMNTPEDWIDDALTSLADQNESGVGGSDNSQPIQIYYSPTNHYHFDSEAAPTKEDIAGAETMSQEEFERRISLYMKNQQRRNFRG